MEEEEDEEERDEEEEEEEEATRCPGPPRVPAGLVRYGRRRRAHALTDQHATHTRTDALVPP